MEYLPAIMDIEASGFGPLSYPIEIGYITETGERFCCLIRPHHEWVYWDKKAEDVHGISRRALIENGKDIRWVATQLNQQLAEKTLYSDGWVVDSTWLNELFFRAAVKPTFRLSALDMILSELQMERWHEMKERLHAENTEVRHRASSDAKVIQLTYQQTR
jgi:hypothetical protein